MEFGGVAELRSMNRVFTAPSSPPSRARLYCLQAPTDCLTSELIHRNGLILPHSGPPCVLGRCVQAGVIQASRSPSAGRQLRPLPLSRSSPFVLHRPCRNPFNSTLVEEFGLWLLPCASSCALYCVATGHPPAPSGSPLSGHSRVPSTNPTHTQQHVIVCMDVCAVPVCGGGVHWPLSGEGHSQAV